MRNIKVNNKKLIGKKTIVTDTGRVYLHGQRLANTKFKVGSRFNIYTDKETNSLAIVISEDGKYKVAKRTTKLKDGSIVVTPVLDLKSNTVKDIFKGYEISLAIYSDCIVVKKTSNTVKKKSCISKLVDLVSYKKKVKSIDVNIDKIATNIYMQIAAGQYTTVQMSLFDTDISEEITSSNKYTYSSFKDKILTNKPTMASFFSGMGGLDLAFKKVGFEGIFALDKSFHKDTQENRRVYGESECSVLEDYHIQTFKKNIGDYIVDSDFLTHSIKDIPDFDVGVFGIPCVELSSVSPNRNKFKMLPRFIDKFIEIMKAKKNSCIGFVIENSKNLITSGRVFLEKIKEQLDWLTITEHSVDAADFGSGQHRKRAIIIGSAIGEINLELPKLREFNTVRNCFKGLNDSIPNQKDYSIPRADTVKRMSYIPQGGNWTSVPEHLRKKGKFSNYMRRLSLDEPSIAIANIRKSLITHPLENRILSIREQLRLFDIPDTFIPVGPLSAMQQMIANSCPLKLGQAIAKTIMNKFKETGLLRLSSY